MTEHIKTYKTYINPAHIKNERNTQMKIKKGFMLRKLGTDYAAVAMGTARKNFNGLIRMNETGKFLWDCLQTDCTEEELIQKLLEEYDTSREEARKDITEFTSGLRRAEILVQ